MSKRRAGTPQVHTITSAPNPLGADIDRRARRYILQMSLRTLCFLSAVFTWGRVPTAVSVTLLIGAVVLPYVAVVLANAGRERPERADPFTDLALAQLTAAPHPVAGVPHGPAGRPSASAPFASADRPTWDDESRRGAARGSGGARSGAAPDGVPWDSSHRG